MRVIHVSFSYIFFINCHILKLNSSGHVIVLKILDRIPRYFTVVCCQTKIR